jgi:DNA-binding XRE family transcriptional regulator
MTTKKSKDSSGSKFEKQMLGYELTFGMAAGSLRVRDDYTQAEFAKKLGVSRQYLCDVEKGRRLASPEQAARFAKVFGHPPAVLVRMALQEAVNAGGLKLVVKVEAA